MLTGIYNVTNIFLATIADFICVTIKYFVQLICALKMFI